MKSKANQRKQVAAGTLLILLSLGIEAGSFPAAHSIVRGATQMEATLTFLCDDGGRYTTQSRSYGLSRPRFSLTLPRDRICRLLIRPRGSSLPSLVRFRDHRGNRSPLIYLKAPRIDLGTIRSLPQGPFSFLPGDEAMLAAVDDPPPNASELCHGQINQSYQQKKKM